MRRVETLEVGVRNTPAEEGIEGNTEASNKGGGGGRAEGAERGGEGGGEIEKLERGYKGESSGEGYGASATTA